MIRNLLLATLFILVNNLIFAQQTEGEAQFSRDATSLMDENMRIDSSKTYTFQSPFDSVKSAKDYYHYQANTTTLIEYSYDSEDGWVFDKKFFVKKNGNGNVIKSVEYRTQDGDWLPIVMLTYSYDDNGNESEKATYNWDNVDNEWNLSWRYEYSYNENSRIKEKISYQGVTGSESDTIFSKDVYEYSDFDSLKTQITYTHDGDSYVKDEKDEYAYNDMNQKTSVITWQWSVALDSWQWDTKVTFNYNDENLLEEKEELTWDLANFEWIPYSDKYSYAYNSSGQRTQEINYVWESADQEYRHDSKYEWGYTGEHVTLKILYSNYDEESGEFIPSEKREYSFNSEGNKTLHLLHYWDNENEEWVGNLKQTYQYNNYGDLKMYDYYTMGNASGEWEITNRTYYYYTDVSGIAETDNTHTFSIYPNPATNYAKLEIRMESPADIRVKIYNNSGKLVYSKRQDDYSGEDIRWNTSAMPSGIYFAEVETSEQSITKRVIVK